MKFSEIGINNNILKAIKDLARTNKLADNPDTDPPLYLGILKAVYTLYLQESNSGFTFTNNSEEQIAEFLLEYSANSRKLKLLGD